MTIWPDDQIDQMTVLTNLPDDQMTRWPDDNIEQITRWPDYHIDQMTILTKKTDDRIAIFTRWPDMIILTRSPDDKMTRCPADQMTIITRLPEVHMTRWSYDPIDQVDKINHPVNQPASKSVTTTPKIGTSSPIPDTMMIYDDLTIMM